MKVRDNLRESVLSLYHVDLGMELRLEGLVVSAFTHCATSTALDDTPQSLRKHDRKGGWTGGREGMA